MRVRAVGCASAFAAPDARGHPATYFWRACADEPNATIEADETNNCVTRETVLGPGPSALAAQGIAVLVLIAMHGSRRRFNGQG